MSLQGKMMRLASHALNILTIATLLVGSSCGPVKDVDADAETENPLLQNVLDTVSHFDGFAPRSFAKVDGWTVWYFQTSFGFKCVASKPAEDEKAAPPGAVFMRQSVGDLRLDIWIDDGDPALRVPTAVGELNYETSGYYRPPDGSFFKRITYEELEPLDGKSVELKPDTTIIGSYSNGPIDLSGIKAATALLHKCDASGPAK